MITMKGKSSFSLQLIESRLAQLQQRDEPHDEETRREIAYLINLRDEKFGTEIQRRA